MVSLDSWRQDPLNGQDQRPRGRNNRVVSKGRQTDHSQVKREMVVNRSCVDDGRLKHEEGG
jgi:hypothetical protein